MLDIQNTVEKIVKKYNTTDPFELCEYMGINVLKQELPESVNGFFVKIMQDYVIIINDSCSYEKSKFILAHEMGHIILHGDTNSIDLRSNTNLCVERLENQADYFAGYLLIKEHELDADNCCDMQMTSENVAMLTGIPERVVRYVLRGK